MPDCLRTVFFGLFYLTWMSEVFRSLLLNLPMNPKCGKTRACQLPSMKHFSLVFINPSFIDKTEILVASVCGFSPLWFTGVVCFKKNISKCFVYPQTPLISWPLFPVYGTVTRFFFSSISTIDLECESKRIQLMCGRK